MPTHFAKKRGTGHDGKHTNLFLVKRDARDEVAFKWGLPSSLSFILSPEGLIFFLASYFWSKPFPFPQKRKEKKNANEEQRFVMLVIVVYKFIHRTTN